MIWPTLALPMSYPFCQPADVLFCRSEGWLPRGIRWAERTPGEDPAWANHMALVTRPGYLVPPPNASTFSEAWVSESLWKNRNGPWWSKYRNSPGYTVQAFRPRGLSQNETDAIVADALSRVGKQYGVWRLFTFGLERITGLPWTRLHLQKRLIVCSNHVALALRAGGRSLGKNPNRVDPDDGLDYVGKMGEEWQFVGWTAVPART